MKVHTVFLLGGGGGVHFCWGIPQLQTLQKFALVNLIIHDCQFKPAASPRFYLNFKLGQLPVIFLYFVSSVYFLFES